MAKMEIMLALGEVREAVKLLLKKLERMTKEMTEKKMKLKSFQDALLDINQKKKALDSNVRILHQL